MASSAARESRVDGDELLLEPQATTRELRACRLDTPGSRQNRYRRPSTLDARRIERYDVVDTGCEVNEMPARRVASLHPREKVFPRPHLQIEHADSMGALVGKDGEKSRSAIW